MKDKKIKSKSSRGANAYSYIAASQEGSKISGNRAEGRRIVLAVDVGSVDHQSRSYRVHGTGIFRNRLIIWYRVSAKYIPKVKQMKDWPYT